MKIDQQYKRYNGREDGQKKNWYKCKSLFYDLQTMYKLTKITSHIKIVYTLHSSHGCVQVISVCFTRVIFKIVEIACSIND